MSFSVNGLFALSVGYCLESFLHFHCLVVRLNMDFFRDVRHSTIVAQRGLVRFPFFGVRGNTPRTLDMLENYSVKVEALA